MREWLAFVPQSMKPQAQLLKSGWVGDRQTELQGVTLCCREIFDSSMKIFNVKKSLLALQRVDYIKK